MTLHHIAKDVLILALAFIIPTLAAGVLAVLVNNASKDDDGRD